MLGEDESAAGSPRGAAFGFDTNTTMKNASNEVTNNDVEDDQMNRSVGKGRKLNRILPQITVDSSPDTKKK